MPLRGIACTFSLLSRIQKLWKRLQKSIRNFRFWVLFTVHTALGHLGCVFSTCPLQPQGIGTYSSAKWDSQVIVQTQQMEFKEKVPILPDRDMGQAERWWMREVQRYPNISTWALSGHQADFSRQLAPEEGREKKSFILRPRIFRRQMYPRLHSSHTHLFFLPVSGLMQCKVWSGCQGTGADPAQGGMPRQLNAICTHTCPSFTLALKLNHLAVPAVHCASFHRSWPTCPSLTSKEKSPQDFYSK